MHANLDQAYSAAITPTHPLFISIVPGYNPTLELVYTMPCEYDAMQPQICSFDSTLYIFRDSEVKAQIAGAETVFSVPMVADILPIPFVDSSERVFFVAGNSVGALYIEEDEESQLQSAVTRLKNGGWSVLPSADVRRNVLLFAQEISNIHVDL